MPAPMHDIPVSRSLSVCSAAGSRFHSRSPSCVPARALLPSVITQLACAPPVTCASMAASPCLLKSSIPSCPSLYATTTLHRSATGTADTSTIRSVRPRQHHSARPLLTSRIAQWPASVPITADPVPACACTHTPPRQHLISPKTWLHAAAHQRHSALPTAYSTTSTAAPYCRAVASAGCRTVCSRGAHMHGRRHRSLRRVCLKQRRHRGRPRAALGTGAPAPDRRVITRGV